MGFDATAFKPADSCMLALLKCPICREVLEIPTDTPCGHSFCAECLRLALEFGSTCPVCRAEVNGTQQTRANRTVAQIIDALPATCSYCDWCGVHGSRRVHTRDECDAAPDEVKAEIMAQDEEHWNKTQGMLAAVPTSAPSSTAQRQDVGQPMAQTLLENVDVFQQFPSLVTDPSRSRHARDILDYRYASSSQQLPDYWTAFS